MNKIVIKRWIVVEDSFNFKTSTPAIYFHKSEALKTKVVYYPNRKDIKVKSILLLI